MDRWFITSDIPRAWRAASTPLQVLIEQGWIGLVLTLSLVAIAATSVLNRRRVPSAAAALPSIIALIAVGLFETVLHVFMGPASSCFAHSSLRQPGSPLTVTTASQRCRGLRGLPADPDAVTEDLVVLSSIMATLRSTDVDAFISEMATLREYCPEYRDFPVVGILATLAVEEIMLSYTGIQGFLVPAGSDEVTEVKNRPAFEPKRWRRPGAENVTHADIPSPLTKVRESGWVQLFRNDGE
jgi:hypothetical protein